MTSHGLLITHLSLKDLHQKKYGIYRRLAMLTEATASAGVVPRIFCVEPYAEARSSDQLASEIAADIRALWGIDCEVIVGRSKSTSKLPWLFQQILGALNYRWQPLPQHLLDRDSSARLAAEIDKAPAFIVAHRLPMMSLLLRQSFGRTPIFFDLDDIEHLAAARGIKQLHSLRNKLFAALSLPSLVYAEATAIATAQSTFVCSQIDAQRTGKLFRSRKMVVLPNAVDIPEIEYTVPSAPIILMVGIYSYGPNKDAADHFISDIFPLIQKENPAVEVWFVGGGADHLQAFTKEQRGVRFLGFVENLGSIYNQARVVICPIRQGSGTRVKLVEAAAWGKPIVTTTIGAEGLNMADDYHALFGDTAQTFAKQCLALLTDAALCEKLAKNARALAEQTYDKRQIVLNLTRKLSAPSD